MAQSEKLPDGVVELPNPDEEVERKADENSDADKETDTGTGDEDDVDTSDEDDESDEDEDDSDDDDEDDSDEEDEDEPEFEKRFTQVKGDTPEEYLKNLEETYAHSSQEAVRLKNQNDEMRSTLETINQLAIKDPELAEKLEEALAGEQPLSPALVAANEEFEKKQQEGYHRFNDRVPEVANDPELQQELLTQLTVVSKAYYKKTKKLIDMEQGLKTALSIVRPELYEAHYSSTVSKEDKVRKAAKDQAAKSKTTSSPKKKSQDEGKPEFSAAQLKFAKRAYPGLSEDKLREKLREGLAASQSA